MQADTNVAALIASRLPVGAECCRERLTVCVTFCVIVGDLLRAGGRQSKCKALGKSASDGDQKEERAVCCQGVHEQNELRMQGNFAF